MKIGILTFHRACNHGAVLQCFALQEKFRELGHEAYVLDYRQQYIEELYAPFNIFAFIRKRRNMIGYLKGSMERLLRMHLFRKFTNKYFKIVPFEDNTICEKIDTYVIGSDQVWSKNCTGKVDPVYFGDFNRKKEARVIGYGISVPRDLLGSIDKTWLRNKIESFDVLSMREHENTNYLRQLINREDIYTVVDPTLLMPKPFYERLVNKKVPRSVVVSLYRYRMDNGVYAKVMAHAHEMAESYNCKVVNISKKVIDPSEFLAWIKNAYVVVTNSFHTTVFSLIFEKKMCIIPGKDNLDSRYISLLTKVGALGKDVDDDCIDLAPDYNLVGNKMMTYIEESNEFIYRFLKNEK